MEVEVEVEVEVGGMRCDVKQRCCSVRPFLDEEWGWAAWRRGSERKTVSE